MKTDLLRLLVAIVVLSGLALPARRCDAQEEPAIHGASLTGRIVYAGDLPVPERLEITRDEEYCGPFQLVDESLVVHAETRGVRYVAIWLDSRSAVPIPPGVGVIPKKPPVLDNRECRFGPRMLAVRTGQTVEFKNSDPVAHNVAVFARRNQPFSEIVPATQPIRKTFSRAETEPIRVDCSIHAWMRSYLLISDHPYTAVTDADGRFRITGLPAGEWKFRFWHERPGHLRELQQNDKSIPLDRGSWTMTITDGSEIDLGDLSAPAAQFAAKK